MQVNYLTRQAYKGDNQAALEELKTKAGFQSSEWLTFLQAKQANLKVKAGVHGIRLKKVTEQEDEKGAKHRRVKGSVVFNIDQTEKANS
jgi:antirestriction protein ArdC